MSYQVYYRLSVRRLLMFGAALTIAVGVWGLAESELPQVLPLVLLIWG